MAAPGIPFQFYVTQANQQVLLQWAISVGATSYDVQRSLDGVTYASVATPAVNQYLDTAVTIGVQYYYKVASVNGSGTSPYTAPQSAIPTPTAEMSLAGLRLAAQQKADMVRSQFVSLPEWNTFINLAMYELYDLLITTYEDYFLAPPVHFTANNSTGIYPLPDGTLTFLDVNNTSVVAPPMYKFKGMDLGLNTSANSFVTINKFNFTDRNRYVYPNSNSTIYGVFNLQYRVLGTNIHFIPAPTSGQILQLWYVPRLPELLKDTDLTTIGFSGWLQYVVVRAAKYALDKEESDTTTLNVELATLAKRIEDSASNRDEGLPDTISNTRDAFGGRYGDGGGWAGPIGGF